MYEIKVWAQAGTKGGAPLRVLFGGKHYDLLWKYDKDGEKANPNKRQADEVVMPIAKRVRVRRKQSV